jgi:hypothetical protein
MELLKRADLPKVELRSERVTVSSLGGDVIVRGLMLAQSLQLAHVRAKAAAQAEGETVDDAQMRAGATYAAAVLACQVLDADDQPLMSAEQWSIWGGRHADEFQQLYDAATRANGGAGEAEKN